MQLSLGIGSVGVKGIRKNPSLAPLHRWSTEGFGNAWSDKRKVFTRRIALRTQNQGDHPSIGIGRSSSDDG